MWTAFEAPTFLADLPCEVGQLVSNVTAFRICDQDLIAGAFYRFDCADGSP
jgi:hypothetical protein